MRLAMAGLASAVVLLIAGCGSALGSATVSLSSQGQTVLSVHSGQNFQVSLTAQPGCHHAGFRFRTGASPNWRADPYITTVDGNVEPVRTNGTFFLPEGQLSVEVLDDDGQGTIGEPVAHPCNWSATVTAQ